VKTPKNILLGLDLSPADAALMAWMRFYVETTGLPQHITLMHNIYIDVDWMQAQGQVFRSNEVREAIEAELKQKLDQAGWSEALRARVSIHVDQNKSTVKAIQSQVKADGIDTAIFGRKTYFAGRGGMFKNLLRNIQTLDQVVLVPESAPYLLERLLIPVDFSERSFKLALSGVQYGVENEVEPVFCYVYRLPQVYFPFIPVDKLSAEKASEVEHKMADFVKKINSPIPIRTKIQYAKGHSIAEGIRRIATQERADLILMKLNRQATLKETIIDDTLLQLISSPADMPIWINK